jgi:hypothetical protein
MQEAFNYLIEYKLDILAYDLPAELSFETEERDMMLDLLFEFVKDCPEWLDELIPPCAKDQMEWFLHAINNDHAWFEKEAYWKYLAPAMTEWLRENYSDFKFQESIAHG